MMTPEMLANVTEKFGQLGWKPDEDWFYLDGIVYLIPEEENIEVGTIEELDEMDEHEFATHVAIHNLNRSDLLKKIIWLKAALAKYQKE